MSSRIASLSSVLSLALVLPACTYDSGHHHGCMDGEDCQSNNPPADYVAQAVIDTGATLGDVQPGEGAGAFIEYQAGGKWHVFTACDSAISGYSCTWDIIAGTDKTATVTSFEPEALESDDYLDWYNDWAVRLVGETTNDLDGFWLEATPGASLTVDVYLDGAPAPRYIYWVGGGGLQQGSPTNPIELSPSAP